MARRSAVPRLVARVSEHGLLVEQQNLSVVCDHTHLDVPTSVRTLPTNQKARFRHVCAGCAYEAGYRDGQLAAAEKEE
jgi:hypothetical protein